MSYIRFINCYKQNAIAKKKYYYFDINKKSQQILLKFIELGLIASVKYIDVKTKKCKIFINYTNKTTVFKTLKILLKLGKKINISLKTTLKLKKYKTNSTFLMLSSKGIITNFEAINFKIGGVLLCKCNY